MPKLLDFIRDEGEQRLSDALDYLLNPTLVNHFLLRVEFTEQLEHHIRKNLLGQLPNLNSPSSYKHVKEQLIFQSLWFLITCVYLISISLLSLIVVIVDSNENTILD